jgi:glycosyltransferase involved in cell wall biosynthesis
MMILNENVHLIKSLETVVGVADTVIILDTGSTDNTLILLEEFVEKHHLRLLLKHATFTDFSTTRNILLDFADTHQNIDYYLLLDASDELRGGDVLRSECLKYRHIDNETLFIVSQHWWLGTSTKYKNTRLMKAHSPWRYKGVVHEYLSPSLASDNSERFATICIDQRVELYQDRTADNNRTFQRFFRDEVLLRQALKNEPTNLRYQYYLAQTLESIGKYKDAFTYYMKRAETEGYREEQFQALLRAGKIALNFLELPEMGVRCLLKSITVYERAEPYYFLSLYYDKLKAWGLAYTFAKRATQLPYPEGQLLFIDEQIYQHLRYRQLAIMAYYAEEKADGKLAAEKAANATDATDLDRSNLTFY